MTDNELTTRTAGQLAAPERDMYADMMREAIAQGEAGVAALERLVALQERREAAEALREFNVALAQFQADAPPIPRQSEGAHRGKYAKRDAILRLLRPTLAANGLSVTYDSEDCGDSVVITTIVRHAAGHVERGRMRVSKESPSSRMNLTQRDGSANEYACRYALGNALGITTGDADTDGRHASDAPSAATVTEEQAATLRALEQEVGCDAQRTFFDPAGITCWEELPARMYGRAVTRMEGMR